MFIFLHKTWVTARLLRDLLVAIFTNRARHNEIRMTRKLIHAHAQRVTMIFSQMIMDFGAFTAKFAIRTFEHRFFLNWQLLPLRAAFPTRRLPPPVE